MKPRNDGPPRNFQFRKMEEIAEGDFREITGWELQECHSRSKIRLRRGQCDLGRGHDGANEDSFS